LEIGILELDRLMGKKISQLQEGKGEKKTREERGLRQCQQVTNGGGAREVHR
jgi:hypothetical protein